MEASEQGWELSSGQELGLGTLGRRMYTGGNDNILRELGLPQELLVQACVPDVKSDGFVLQSLNGISERDSPKYRVLQCTMGQLETIIHFLMI